MINPLSNHWEGVVMIERPNLINVPLEVDPMCPVVSARTVQFEGKRAISCELPYSVVKDYFESHHTNQCYLEAEFKDGHLELKKGTNLVLGDFVLYSMTPEQKAGFQ